MGVSTAVLDFYDDGERTVMSKLAMPAEVRGVDMTILDEDRMAGLKDSDFGLIILTKHAHVIRKFPVNDPGNAWLSAQYFQRTHEKLAFPARFVAAKHIKEACTAYGVPSSALVDGYASRISDGEVESNLFTEGSESAWLQRKLAAQEFVEKTAAAAESDALTAMPNQHFALVIQMGDGSVIRKYAMPDAEHVKLAETYFDKYAMQLAPEHRHRYAVAVKGRAEELGVELGDDALVEKWASPTWNTNLDYHLEQRKSLLPHNDKAKGILQKLAASIGETDPAEFAAALEVFDRGTGLDRYYDRGLREPYAASMGKVASGWSGEVDGTTITEQDLRKVAEGPKLASYMGASFAEQFRKDPVSIFESLPQTEKVFFKELIEGGL